ncbi:nuclear transport factor 2 family protein [Jannaschia seohaensis]|uniref:SnoaL-like domain-containing protein n=1 Tax=Jannaschia seohaensis TaxID=475081 RepID=A0A2Y9BBW1_9RHOB|nr:nuclear transport factor 2 family protein [Jannaschia seohaensis]PWJ10047.1 SnoaL-like protein [Jannaschia seohaensis]SSA51799.1 SnoaL-like domain-containing protein [Jannaschia seohaensis]
MTAEPTAARIAQALDRQAIADVLVDYCRFLDSMDLEALAALFTPDCRVVYGDDPRLRAEGRDALRSSLARMWRWRRTAHHLSNIRVWFDAPGRARAESAVWAWHEAQDGSPAEVYGVYDDRLIETAEGWRIDARRMTMRGASAGFRVALPPTERRPPPPGWTTPEGLDG